MPAAPKRPTIVGSRQQSIMGMERVIDDARDLNLRGVVLGGERPAVGRTEPAAPPKRHVGRPTNEERAAREAKERHINGVTLQPTAYPAPPPLPEDISDDSVETVEIELPDDAMFLFGDDAPELPMRRVNNQPSPYVPQIAKLSKKQPFLLIAAPKNKPHKDSFGSYVKSIAIKLGVNVTVRKNFEYFGRTGLGVWYVGVLPKKE